MVSHAIAFCLGAGSVLVVVVGGIFALDWLENRTRTDHRAESDSLMADELIRSVGCRAPREVE